MTDTYLSIPGHIPLKEAARRLHRSEKRVLQYITTQRLPAHKIQGRYMIPISAIETFRQHPHGRTRTAPTRWRIYRAGAQVRLLSIEAPIVVEKHAELLDKLHALPRQQQHLFPGTMQRFISLDQQEPGHVRIILIWKTTDLLDETTLQRDLSHFQLDFADVLDWKHALVLMMESIAHT